jgi:hypothetical protein
MKKKQATDVKPLNLFSISAVGDQSFIITSSPSDNIPPLDFRHILQKNQILTVNVVKQLSKTPLTLSLTKSNAFATTAVINSSQL